MKMKNLSLLLFSIFPLLIFAQSDTDILLFDINTDNGKIEISNMKNVSNNEGYDNQPSFFNDNTVFYAGTRNGQTDIVQYNINYDSKIFINHTDGGEYSPLKVPNKNEVTAVRLDKDGKQRLYTYSLNNGESKELIADLVVAYYTWHDENLIVSAVIEENGLNLFVNNIKYGTNKKIQNNVGRSFHNIPNTNLVSYISKEDENNWQIKSLNPKTGETKVVANTMPGVEDICWVNNTTILSGKGSVLYKLTLQKDNNWKQITDLGSKGVSKITRLLANKDSNKLLIAGELVATANTDNTTKKEEQNTGTKTNTEISELEHIVQKQLEAYNSRNIDEFMATYTQNVKLYNYPNELISEGQEPMRKSYKQWFEQTKDLKALITKRMVIGNKIIDEQQVTANGQIFNAIAIYEVENALISKVTFIR